MYGTRLICSAAQIRCILLLCAAAVFVMGCGGGGGGNNGGGGGSTDTTAPVISSPSATPTELQPVGGKITITAIVTDNVAVASVTATITKPNNGTVTVPMSASSGSTYTASWQPDIASLIPSGVFKIVITAKDAAGNTAASPQLTVTVEGPPPPPT
ncbi:MAG: Ig-like domain-containing protein [Armatimonadota bacterium]|nr:Ig-like domain-containing protein [Armatimonadota bacterium]